LIAAEQCREGMYLFVPDARFRELNDAAVGRERVGNVLVKIGREARRLDLGRGLRLD
jgi:hypothetical protein